MAAAPVCEAAGAPLGEVLDPVAFVPFRVMARFLNAVKLRGELWTGLMANTIPRPQ